MKPKILVLYKKEDEKKSLEEILSELVEKGVEIFFTDKKQSALDILKNEKPQLTLIDSNFDNQDFINTSVIMIYERKEKAVGEILIKPFHKHQVLETLMKHLDLSEIEIELPM